MCKATKLSRIVRPATLGGLVLSLSLVVGCAERHGRYRCIRRVYRPCSPVRRPSYCLQPSAYPVCDDEPQSWVRIEGDVYTQSYLESLQRFQNDY